MTQTHEVANQATSLAGHDVASDRTLIDALHREGAGCPETDLHVTGVLAGSKQTLEWARQANQLRPDPMHAQPSR